MGPGVRRDDVEMVHSHVSPEILPDGQIAELLSSPLCKNISVPALPKSNLYRSRPVPQRGVGHRHWRGAGCGGRGSVGRCQGMAGRVDKARELTNGTQTNDAW